MATKVMEKQVTVVSITDTSITIQIDQDRTVVEKADLFGPVADVLAQIKGNMQIALALAAVDPNNAVAIQEAIESRTFKVVVNQ